MRGAGFEESLGEAVGYVGGCCVGEGGAEGAGEGGGE